MHKDPVLMNILSEAKIHYKKLCPSFCLGINSYIILFSSFPPNSQFTTPPIPSLLVSSSYLTLKAQANGLRSILILIPYHLNYWPVQEIKFWSQFCIIYMGTLLHIFCIAFFFAPMNDRTSCYLFYILFNIFKEIL